MLGDAVVIGTGNLAHHFLPVLKNLKGLNLRQILGRSTSDGRYLESRYQVEFEKDVNNICKSADVVFLMVSDSAIAPLTQKLKKYLDAKTLIIHFSGTAKLDEIDPFFKKRGNIWPVQSFSKEDKDLVLTSVPMCVHAASPEVIRMLIDFTHLISNKVVEVSQNEKASLHLSAVIVNNFTNHLYDLTYRFLEERQLDFSLLLPLIDRTSSKIKNSEPSAMQTGPAVRGDQNTMQKHIQALNADQELQQIYKLLSSSINRNSQ